MPWWPLREEIESEDTNRSPIHKAFFCMVKGEEYNAARGLNSREITDYPIMYFLEFWGNKNSPVQLKEHPCIWKETYQPDQTDHPESKTRLHLKSQSKVNSTNRGIKPQRTIKPKLPYQFCINALTNFHWWIKACLQCLVDQ